VPQALGPVLQPVPVSAREGTEQAAALPQRYCLTLMKNLEPAMSIVVPGWAAVPDWPLGLVVVLQTLVLVALSESLQGVPWEPQN
tara:strand:- start:809 stop:1063 length:255 start_codon:yes stop_codon:yes gene_type:complete